MSTAEAMTQDVIATLCNLMFTRLEVHGQGDGERGRAKRLPELRRIMGLWHFVTQQLVPKLSRIPEEGRMRVQSDDHGNGPYEVIQHFMTPDGASFEVRQFVDSPDGQLLGYSFSPAPLMNHAELYYNPKAAEFFITKNGLVGFTVNVVYASPIFDFGLGLADL